MSTSCCFGERNGRRCLPRCPLLPAPVRALHRRIRIIPTSRKCGSRTSCATPTSQPSSGARSLARSFSLALSLSRSLSFALSLSPSLFHSRSLSLSLALSILLPTYVLWLSSIVYVVRIIIYLITFLSHTRISLCIQVNFIGGDNGSGKSSILTAVAFAFGARAEATGRAHSNKDFVGPLEERATVAMRIVQATDDKFAPKLPQGYLPDEFIIERRSVQKIRLRQGFRVQGLEVRAQTRTSTRANTHAHKVPRTHARTHTRTHARSHARTHTHTHARTHTHTQRVEDGEIGGQDYGPAPQDPVDQER